MMTEDYLSPSLSPDCLGNIDKYKLARLPLGVSKVLVKQMDKSVIKFCLVRMGRLMIETSATHHNLSLPPCTVCVG